MTIQIWKPGDKIKNGRFEVLKELGKGGFGITYLVRDFRKNENVVIKTLNATQQSDKNFADIQENFVKEGFTLNKFDHHHIVKVSEPVQLGQLWGLVMEYIPGEDLSSYMDKNGRLSEGEALGYIDQIAQALDYVHEKKFFHRDVKPENIMLRQGQREAVLIDFGIAREFIDLETVYLTNDSGTKFYKPIEQYSKRGIFGPHTDVYALAVTLYHLLTGALPGRGSPFYTSMGRKEAQDRGMGEKIEEYLWAELIKVGVSNKTLAAIQAGMAIEPEDRLKNMIEFRSLLSLLPTTKTEFTNFHVEAIGSAQKHPVKPSLLVDHHQSSQDELDQWQGMLAAIAFAEIRNFPLKAEHLDVQEVRRCYPFAEAIWQLQSDNEIGPYKTRQENFIWTWDGKLVGRTSLRMIVVPVPDAQWTGLPWWNQEDRKLMPPQPYLCDEEKCLFGGWLSNLLKEANNSNYDGNPHVVSLLHDFQNSLGCSAAEADIFDQDSPQYFGIPFKRGVMKGLNRPIKLKKIGYGGSFIKIINSIGKTPAKPLLLIDPCLATVWGIAPRQIQVHKNTTMASLNIEDLRAGRIEGWDDVRCIEPRDLFLPELAFIDVDDALPGGFPVQSNQPLLFNNNKITPLLPFNSLLLEYFTPEDLMGRVRFTQNGSMVRVVLKLPLAGIYGGANGHQEEYNLLREYTLNEQNAVKDVPVLELWPNLKIPNWQDYYAFYFDANDTFNVSFGDAIEPHDYKDRNGNYMITRLSDFHTCVSCYRHGYPVGIILLETPNKQN